MKREEKKKEKGGHHEKEVTHAAQAKQRQRRKTGPPRRSQRSKAQPGKAPGRHTGECPSACEEAEGLEVGASSSWDAGSAAVAGTRPGEAEEHSGGSPRGTGAGGPGTRGRRAHTQRVLNVDQPAVKSEKLGDQDQLIGHRPVRALVPGQEGLTEPLPVFPFSDESPCGAGEKQGQARGSFPLLPSNSQGVVPATSASLLPAKKMVRFQIPSVPRYQMIRIPWGQGPRISVRQ